jgi:general secretion pathway protein G
MAFHIAPGSRAPGRAGFTLIELLVVLAIIALLVTIATPRVIDHLERAREATLRASLKELRGALDRFEADLGRPPAALAELVERRYLRAIPVDPITERDDTWVALAPSETPSRADLDAAAGGVVDVRSGADGAARDGSRFADW